jgi:hypothetical protein
MCKRKHWQMRRQKARSGKLTKGTRMYRQKRHRISLAAKGYLSLQEFTKWVESKKHVEKLTKESEESSNDDATTVPRLWSNRPSSFKGMDIEELAPPSAASECRQVVQNPAASTVHCRVTQDLRDEEEESTQSEDEEKGTAHENRQDVARENGTHQGHTV